MALVSGEADPFVAHEDEAVRCGPACEGVSAEALVHGMQEDFVAALTDSIDSGVGRLVDADMNEESTRLKALQTQQQLAIQSLSIANTSSESILTLFRQ